MAGRASSDPRDGAAGALATLVGGVTRYSPNSRGIWAPLTYAEETRDQRLGLNGVEAVNKAKVPDPKVKNALKKPTIPLPTTPKVEEGGEEKEPAAPENAGEGGER